MKGAGLKDAGPGQLRGSADEGDTDNDHDGGQDRQRGCEESAQRMQLRDAERSDWVGNQRKDNINGGDL